MKSKIKVTIGAIIILVAVVVVPRVIMTPKIDRGSVNAETNVQVVDSSIAVKSEDINDDVVNKTIYSLGKVEATEEYKVNAKVEGKVTGVYHKVGDYVKKGEVLFDIESKDFNVDKNAKLVQSLNGITQAEVNLKTAKDNYDKYTVLYKDKAVSDTDYNNIKAQYDNAKLAYDNADKSHQSLENTYSNKADDYRVKSPVSGVIAQEDIAVGMDVTYQNGFTIEVVDNYKIMSQVPSKFINQIKVGQKANVYVSTLDKTIEGVVSTVSYSGSNGTYPIEIQLESEGAGIKPGMFADVRVIAEETSEGLWVPSNSLIEADGESYIYIEKDNKAKRVDVQVLYRNGERVAVKGDISAADRVITYGKEYILDGTLIKSL